jgi:GT2 family glycosyltransferase
MKTAVVILNWNTKDFLHEFLPPLLDSVKDAEVIVADSASTDGSMELMAKEFPSVRRIELDKNYGFTGGYDRAFEAIKGDGFKYYVLLNTDIEVSPGWLGPLTEWMDAHPECGACSPKLHSYYDRDKFEYAGAAGGMIDKYGFPFCRGRVMNMVEKDEGQYDGSPAEVLWATGACLMVRASLWEKLGGLDDRFFAHMEEIDFCWRLQLDGYKVNVIPASLVYHLGGGTLPKTSPWKLKLNYRNNLLLLENNLAKTFALGFYRSMDKNPSEAGKAAKKGCRKAGRRICARMWIDGLTAIVYLLTGKFSFFKAVWKAHGEFRSLRRKPTPQETEKFIVSHPDSTVKGLCGKWIVPRAFIGGEKVFGLVHKIG